jgi:short subunit dehydrogenase-like uncharacterized protein
LNPRDALGGREGSKVECMVDPTGALWNNQLTEELRKLHAVVAAARTAPLKPRKNRPYRRRPGWATPLVLSVLREAAEPMTAADVVRAIGARFGTTVALPTVRTALRTSKAARSGAIAQVAPGRYRTGAASICPTATEARSTWNTRLDQSDPN